MSYVKRALVGEETVLHTGQIHWSVFFFSATLLAAAGALAAATVTLFSANSGSLALAAGLGSGACLVGALLDFVWAALRVVSTEVAVTTQRTIVKTGLLRTDTAELNHRQLESIEVTESLLGRMLGYGSLRLHGTGGGITQIANLSAPLDFRRAALGAAESRRARETQPNASRGIA
ncbi:MAG: PH domain-containing protein [Planctomycetota bacterium]